VEERVAGLQKAIAQLMEGRQERGDPPALARLLAGVSERVIPAERAHADVFAREIWARMPPVHADTTDPAALAAMIASAFAFVRDRRTSPIAVRTFVPDADRDGWSSTLTVVETVIDDRPFIVETLHAALEATGGEVRLVLHPVLGIERAVDGGIVRIGGPDDAATRESFVHAEVGGIAPTPQLQQQLAERLRQLIRVTGDYAAMREHMTAISAELRSVAMAGTPDVERHELAAFIDWLGDKSFVYLGYREYDLRDGSSGREAVLRPGSGLGLLRDETRSRYQQPQRLPPSVAAAIDPPPLWILSMTRTASPVHRLVPMEDLSIPYVVDGRATRVRRLLGLFTAKAYGDAASDVPILRRRVADVLARAGAVPESHDARDIVGLFNSFPRHELLASRPADLEQLLDAIRSADPHAGLELVCRPDAIGGALFATVLVPRARFSTELHTAVSARVRHALQAAALQEHLALDERPIARLHYACAAPDAVLARPPVAALRAELSALLRTWNDELREVLARSLPGRDAERLAAHYAQALPPAYTSSTAVAVAAHDIELFEQLRTSGDAQIEFVPPARAAGPYTLKLYLANEPLVLSDFVPVVENLGLRALGQDVVELQLPALGSAALHTFAVAPTGTGDVGRHAPQLIAALRALRAGAVENDPLNSLVLNAGLDWRAADVLRAYVDHAAQLGIAPRPTLMRSLTDHPTSAAHLFAVFAAKFDPAAGTGAAGDRVNGPVAAAHRQLIGSLEAVQSLVADRALRALAELVDATVRTNFYGLRAGAALALKLDARRLEAIAAPRPMIETWVHAPQLSGVHLRAGRVARGGIRASDRPDDFRTEILRLMRTQVVKNAVIVPTGAKGGFVRKAARQRSAAADELEYVYRLFIEALLSVIDNREGDRIVPPPGQIVYDEPDPYFVVAPDKGTATLSDTANAIAAERAFWLGDAFASGGAHGYDHKRLGITARGAWTCAREHFRALGRDLDRDAITVAGIGDMSGDVFGNGLLRSRHLRLLAAFDDRDVFVDPDPDPELSYRERTRLFHQPGSRWTDYDPGSLSRGGGVFARAAKMIPLAPAARALLGIAGETPSGEEVVRAILRLPVDLLWNGGVGTYVKASDELHGDVGDPGNDAVRIDARELRASVVVEGGNLGLTQRARVEYALGGGRINTDAIDNSAGVDLSDHEVNLKIALQPALAAGELSSTERNAVLANVADAVSEAVLAHNRSQSIALDLDQNRSRTQLAPFRDLMSILENEAGLDRSRAHLPSREVLRARRGAFRGLTRPELAVLMAHTKIDLRRRLLADSLCDDPGVESFLLRYFPAEIADRFAARVRQHPLRREIIALELANELVDTMGMTFLVRAVRDSGREVAQVVRSWAAVRAITAAEDVRRALDAAAPTLAAEAEQGIRLELATGLDRASMWLVRTHAPGRPLRELVDTYREPFTALASMWPALTRAHQRDAHGASIERLAAAGLDRIAAVQLADIGDAEDMLEIAYTARLSGMALPVTADAYFAGTTLVDLEWLRRALPSTLPGEDRWEPRAVASLLEVIVEMRRLLTQHVLARRRPGTTVDDWLHRYATEHREQLAAVGELVSDQKAATQPTLPALLVIIREVGRLVRPSPPP
jgi:glutamate dehydrogenase